MSLNNKIAIVTGASSGIGAATAILFAKEGANVAIVARTEAKLNEVAKEIEALGRKALVIKTDLSKEAEVDNVVATTVQHFGKLDILVNNAGFFTEGSLLNGKVLQAYDQVMQVNVRSVIQLCMLAAPHLAKTKGNIVNISSSAGQSVSKIGNFLPYYVSKATLNHFTKCAALELAASGVRVNAVSPGPVDNGFLTNNGYGEEDAAKFKEAISESVALSYIAKSEEIADVILFLAGEKARSVTGSNYAIDNGYLLKN